MSGFSVTPAALDAYANLIGSAKAADAGSTLDYQYLIPYSRYVTDHVKLEGGGVIFAAVKGKVETINTRLGFDSSTISTNLIESAMGLNSAAKVYRDTDFAAAEHLDSIYKPGKVTKLEGTDSNAAAVRPESKLEEPEDEGVVPELAQELLDSAGVFSESDLVLKILRWCGLDVVAWVTDKFAGDHKSLARCKNALSALSEFDETAAEAVSAGAAHMLTQWTGNAADAAQTAFAKTTEGLSGHGVEISGAASRMSALMVGMQEAAASIEGLITTALDRAIEAAAAVAAAGCLQEIPGVDVLADIIGGAEVYRVYRAVKEVTDTWNLIWAGHEGILGLIAGLVGGIASWDVNSELPSVGYYNASQGPAPDYSDHGDRRHGGPQ